VRRENPEEMPPAGDHLLACLPCLMSGRPSNEQVLAEAQALLGKFHGLGAAGMQSVSFGHDQLRLWPLGG
jgi:hypothetical protein